MSSQLIVENENATQWFMAKEAHIFEQNGRWFINAIRDDEQIVWSTMQYKPFPSMQLLPNSSVTIRHMSNKRNETMAFQLELSEIDSVIKNTFDTTVGELVSYSVHKNDNKVIQIYSWMDDFIAAWRSEELFYKAC
jgi:hypothetical protein